ncbi:MAG: hypothetical protein HZB51_29300 [Chloroflexi bacterium]|nr:hypothetical protein [Chloroflexota bacterium]
MNRQMVLFALFALAFSLGGMMMLTTPAFAAGCTWTGNGLDSNHSNPANWSGCGGNFPQSGDAATIPAGLTNYPNVNAAWTVSGLNIASGARVDLNTNAVMTVRGTANTVNGALNFLSNKATVRVEATNAAGSALTFANAPTISGTLELTSSGGTYTPTLTVNSGNLNIAATGALYALKGAGGTAIVNAPITNAGTISVTAPLQINKKGAIHTNSGTFQVAANVTGDGDEFTNGGNLNFVQPDGVFALIFSTCALVRNNAGGNVRVNAGTGVTTTIAAELNNAGTVYVTSTLTLDKNGGMHTNTGTFIVNADVTGNAAEFVNSGNLVFGSTGGLAMPTRRSVGGIGALAFSTCALVRNNAGGNVSVNAGAGVTTTIGAQLVNAGTVAISSTLMLDKPATTHTNSGTFLVYADVTGNGSVFDNSGTLNLEGTIRYKFTITAAENRSGAIINVNTGAGVTTTISAQLNNAGTVNVKSPLVLDKPATTHTNTGALYVAANVTVKAGELVNNGIIEFALADQAKTPTTGNRATGGTVLLIEAGAPVRNNAGGTIRTNALGVTTTIAADIHNGGVINADSALVLNKPTAAYTNTGSINLNSGDVTIDGGALVSQWPAFKHTGAVNIAAGRTFLMNGGTFKHDTGGTLTGAGTLDLRNANFDMSADLTNNVALLKLNNVNVNSKGTLTNAANKTLDLTNCHLEVDLDLVGRIVVGASNIMTGTLTTHPNSTIRLNSDGVNDTTLDLNSPAGLANNGVIEFANPNVNIPIKRAKLNDAKSLVNTSTGVINVAAGQYVTSTISAPVINNAGTVSISNTLEIVNTVGVTNSVGGKIDLKTADAFLDLSSALDNSGAINLVVLGAGAKPSAPQATRATRPGVRSAPQSGGIGTIRNQATGIISVSAPGYTATIDAHLEQKGTLNVSSPLSFPNANAVVTNTGTANIYNTSDFLTVAGQWQENGLLRFTSAGGAGARPISARPNQTVMEWMTLSATVRPGGKIETTIPLVIKTNRLDNQGTMTISNTVSLQTVGAGNRPSNVKHVASPHTNSGTIYLTSGNLAITGDFTQASNGALRANIGGTNPGSQYFQLTTTGATTLGGALNLTWVNGFAPSAGNSFTLVNAGTRTGTFSTVTGLTVGGKTMQTQYGATFVRVLSPYQLFLPLIVR